MIGFGAKPFRFQGKRPYTPGLTERGPDVVAAALACPPPERDQRPERREVAGRVVARLGRHQRRILRPALTDRQPRRTLAELLPAGGKQSIALVQSQYGLPPGLNPMTGGSDEMRARMEERRKQARERRKEQMQKKKLEQAGSGAE